MTEQGVISFLNYEVTKVEFSLNDNFSGDSVKMNIETASDMVLSDDKKQMEILLSVHIFKDAQNNNYPFEMYVQVRGYFVGGEDISQYQANALAILYPYVRAIVSTYTANANVSPLILPTVNINKMLEEK